MAVDWERFQRGGERGLVVLLLAEQRKGWSLMISVLAQRAASEGCGGSGQVPFLLAERAR